MLRWVIVNKSERQQIILNIIQKNDVSSHDELISELAKKNVKIAQATISRDLKDLGVFRQNNKYVTERQTISSWESVVSQRLHRVVAAGPHMLILVGNLGCAPIVSVELEAQRWPEIIGVIAGDDTLFVAFDNEINLNKIKHRLQKALKK